jgi:flagellin-like hook-associated protein FlgL
MLGGSEQLAKSTSLYMESAHRNLSRGLNRLSTGVKLSTGVDDAGGLGVSMNIGAKLKKAFKVRENVQNARSFLEQQDAALSSMGKALDRMAELRTKYDDLVAGRPERELYNKEFKEMQSEMLSMRGRKFNGVSIFSTNPKDPMSFYIPTSDDGISTRVTINRTGFFDSLTIGSSTPGSTPATTFNGAIGSFAGSVQGNAGGSITSVPRTPTSGLHATPIDFKVTAGGTVTDLPSTPVVGASPAIGITVAAGGTVADFALPPVKGAHTPPIAVTVVEGAKTTINATAIQGEMPATNITGNAGGGGTTATVDWTTVIPANNQIEEKAAKDAAGNIYVSGIDTVAGEAVLHKIQPDGTQVGAFSPSIAGATNVTAPVVIGNDIFVGATGPWGFGGFMDQFRIYKFDNNGNLVNQVEPKAADFAGEIQGLEKSGTTLYATGQSTGMAGITAGLYAIDSATLNLDAGFGVGGMIDFAPGTMQRADVAPAIDGAGNIWTAFRRPTDFTRIRGFDNSGTPIAGANYDLPAGELTENTSPVISGNLVVVGTDGGSTGAAGKIYAWNTTTNAQAWGGNPYDLLTNPNTFQGHNPEGIAVAPDGSIYVGTSQGEVHRIDPATGLGTVFDAGVPLFGTNRVSKPDFDNAGNVYISTEQGKTFKLPAGSLAAAAFSWEHNGATPTQPVVDPATGNAVLVAGGQFVQLSAPSTAVTLTNPAPIGSNYLSTDTPTITVKDPAGTVLAGATATVITTGADTGKLNVDLAGVTPTTAGNYTIEATKGAAYLQATNIDNQGILNAYTPGETVTFESVMQGGTVVQKSSVKVTSSTADANGQIDLVFDPTSRPLVNGTTTPIAGVLTLTFQGPLTATPQSTLANVGAGYAPWEAVLVTTNIPKQGGGGAKLTATATNNNDGTLTISALSGIPSSSSSTVANAYNITANAGTIYNLPNENRVAATGNYGNGEAVAVTLTDTVTGLAPVDALAAPITATGTGQADGSVTIAFSGTPTSATPITVQVAPGNLTATPTTVGSLTGVGLNYATVGQGEALNIGATTTVPGVTVSATNQNDGTVNITLSGNVTPGTAPGIGYTVTANAGSVFQLPNENPAAATGSYGNGEAVAVTLTDTGTGLTPVDALAAPITATGTGQADGSVLIAFSGTPTSASPITIKVAPGNLSAAPTTPGTLTGVGTGYAVGEAVTANVTGVTGMTTTATNNNDGTLNIVLGAVPAGTAPGTYQVQANPGTTFQIPNEIIAADAGTSYGNGEVVAVTLTDNVTGLAPAGGLTATGTGQADGSLQINFTNSPTSANPIQVAPGTGSPSLAQTSLPSVGSGYNPAEPVPTITVTDPGGTNVTGTASVTGINPDGTLNVDLTGVNLTAASPTGTYTVATSNGTIASIPTALNGIGSGYSPVEPAPTVTVTDPASATLPGATASINANGTINVNLAGVAATIAGTYTVNATGGTVSGVQQGLDDTSKDLWDFSHADFNNFIQTLTNVRAVNGATTSSLAFSESRLETNIQNLELAGGRIVDADMAEEMVEIAKHQILLQTATDSLTKHNKLSISVDKTLMGLSGGM